MAPRMQWAAQIVEHLHMRRWAQYLGIDDGTRRWRVWYRLPEFRQDRSDDVIRISETVPVRWPALARAAGLSASDIAEPPRGMSEYEAWFFTRHGQTVEAALAAGGTVADGGGMGEARPTRREAARLAPGVRVPQEPAMPDIAGESGAAPPVEASLIGEPAPRPHPGEAAGWGRLVP
jgi:hypothetical protein